MVFRLLASACCLLLLVGCDSSQPRIVTAEPASPNVTTPPDHSNPHAPAPGSPHGMSPESPHGMSPGGTAHPAAGAAQLGPEVQLGSFRLTAPEGWVRQRPASGITRAQFSLPPAEGETGAVKLTVTIAGGGVEANVQRWRQQCGGGAEGEGPEEIEVAGLKVTMVDFTGAFADTHGMTAPVAPAAEQKGSRLLGAIIPIGNSLGFIKCIGPAKTVAAHADEFRAFVETLKLPDKP